MSDNIDKLEGQDLSDAVAREVMGWRYRDSVYGAHWANSDGTWTADATAWKPATDRNNAHSVLMRCEKLGIEIPTWRHIRRVPIDKMWHDHWGLLTIDPAIICRAALKAVRKAKS